MVWESSRNVKRKFFLWCADKVCDLSRSVWPCVGSVCLSLSSAFPEKPSLLADIGQCAGPIRLRRTLAADFSLAASLGWRPRLASISAKRFFRGESRRGHLYQSDAAPSRSRRSVSARGGGWRRIPGDLRPAPVRSVLPPGTPLRARTSPRPASAIRRPVASAVTSLASPSPLPSVRKWGEGSNRPLRDMELPARLGYTAFAKGEALDTTSGNPQHHWTKRNG